MEMNHILVVEDDKEIREQSFRIDEKVHEIWNF